ncbi:MAG: LysR family transcriptional regulator [Negativicutes bacterium]
MELRQLEYFLMVSKLNSFTRAAENLYVSQPTVTSTIRCLEEELGIQLFDRSQKIVALTNEGRVFLKHVEHVMQDVSTTISEMKNLKTLSQGTVKIALPPAMAGSAFFQIFSLFKADYPAINFAIEEPGSKTARQMLLRDETELAVVVCNEQSDFLDISPLFQQKLVVCLFPGHNLSSKKCVTPSDLKNEKLLLLNDDCDLHHLAIRGLSKTVSPVEIFHTSSQVHTLIDMVAAGIGVALLTQSAVENDRRVVWRPMNPPISIEFGLARRKDKYLANAAQAFVNYAKTYFLSK